MYDGTQEQLAGGNAVISRDDPREIAKRGSSPTLAENINERIARAERDIARLQRVRLLLAEPGGLLNVPIDDLRFAMNY